MRKHIRLLLAVLLCAGLLSSCSCKHEWKEEGCNTPKVCSKCGETKEETLGHSWAEATCTSPKTCSKCGETQDEMLGHNWAEATCTAPKTCTTCGETEGEAIGHSWQGTCAQARTCAVCGAPNPEPEHTYAAWYETSQTEMTRECIFCEHSITQPLDRAIMLEYYLISKNWIGDLLLHDGTKTPIDSSENNCFLRFDHARGVTMSMADGTVHNGIWTFAGYSEGSVETGYPEAYYIDVETDTGMKMRLGFFATLVNEPFYLRESYPLYSTLVQQISADGKYIVYLDEDIYRFGELISGTWNLTAYQDDYTSVPPESTTENVILEIMPNHTVTITTDEGQYHGIWHPEHNTLEDYYEFHITLEGYYEFYMDAEMEGMNFFFCDLDIKNGNTLRLRNFYKNMDCLHFNLVSE